MVLLSLVTFMDLVSACSELQQASTHYQSSIGIEVNALSEQAESKP